MSDAPKEKPWPIRASARVIIDRIAPRLGQDEFTLIIVLIDAQNRFRRPVGFWASQLCALCGFPENNPRRLRAAREALRKDHWLVFSAPKNGDRTHTIYDVRSDPTVKGHDARLSEFEGEQPKHLTPIQNGGGEVVDPRQIGKGTPAKTVASPPPNRYPDPHQNGSASSSSIPSSVLTTSGARNSNTPLTPQRGGGGGKLDSSEVVDLDSRKGRKGRTRRPRATTEPVSVPIPDRLNFDPFPEVWGNWQAYLISKRQPLTEQTAAMQLRQFECWGIKRAIDAINFTIFKGYSGLFEPTPTKDGSDQFQGIREFLSDGVPVVDPYEVPYIPDNEDSKYWNPHAPDGGLAEMTRQRRIRVDAERAKHNGQ